ncbi:hypothetical protein N7G274_009152 [Stereocaulon virgatum]|uniref:Uncharacterized protein n=1 Tax=Stereocaulon virgatum TaxID=373712 RepID=A0ABR3ZX21_9LECA
MLLHRSMSLIECYQFASRSNPDFQLARSRTNPITPTSSMQHKQTLTRVLRVCQHTCVDICRYYTINGPDLTYFFDAFDQRGCDGHVTTQALAHAYGEIALHLDCGTYPEVSDILHSKNDYRYHCSRIRHHHEFTYRLNEYNTKDNQTKAYPHFTNRTITASAGECCKYSMVGSPQTQPNGDLLCEYKSDTFNINIIIPAASGALDGATYIYRGINIPQQEVTYVCSPGCILLAVGSSKLW